MKKVTTKTHTTKSHGTSPMAAQVTTTTTGQPIRTAGYSSTTRTVGAPVVQSTGWTTRAPTAPVMLSHAGFAPTGTHTTTTGPMYQSRSTTTTTTYGPGGEVRTQQTTTSGNMPPTTGGVGGMLMTPTFPLVDQFGMPLSVAAIQQRQLELMQQQGFQGDMKALEKLQRREAKAIAKANKKAEKKAKRGVEARAEADKLIAEAERIAAAGNESHASDESGDEPDSEPEQEAETTEQPTASVAQ
eukprot:Polyplicarium_translucidae@DN1186_c0_g1_i1.p2